MLQGTLVLLLAMQLPCSQDAQPRSDESTPPVPNMPVRDALIMLSDAGIQTVLSFSEPQREELLEALRKHQERIIQNHSELGKAPGKASNEERQAYFSKLRSAMAAVEDEFSPMIWRILDAEQLQRAEEIIRQLNAAQALLEPALARKLQLTPQQTSAIEDAVRQHRRARARMRRPSPSEPTLEVRLKAEEKIDSERDEQALKTLTEHQHEQWRNLVGKPLDVAEIRPRISPLHSLRRSAGQRRPRFIK